MTDKGSLFSEQNLSLISQPPSSRRKGSPDPLFSACRHSHRRAPQTAYEIETRAKEIQTRAYEVQPREAPSKLVLADGDAGLLRCVLCTMPRALA